jgi:HK97 family phage major capsid protein
MVQIKEDNQLLNGDGTGVNLTGILNTAGIQNQPQGGDTLPDAIMKAITKIRALAYFEPTGIVVNSQDWSNLVLMKDKAGQYYGAGPFMGPYGQMMKSSHSMWGIPIILTTLIAQGTILVGAFNQGASIFRRMGMTLEVSNSDASDFQYGRMAVRCTTRLALAVYRPLSFCTVTGSGAGGAFN